MPTTADRLIQLRNLQESFTGIDFVQVEEICEQTTLRVYFLTELDELVPPFEGGGAIPIGPEDIRIYSPRGEAPDVRVTSTVWLDDAVALRRYLEVQVEEPGNFTDYRLLITDPRTSGPPRIDPTFNDTTFSFKVGCDDHLDCAEKPPECPPEPMVDFPVDYLARDFVSFRNALLDYSAQRFPEWALPIEADLGVMLAEVMAALGDELSYVQDRYNREAYLETATERRTLRNKARLLDYEIHDGRMATTVLDVTVGDAADPDDVVELARRGETVWAPSDAGPPVPFEVGVGFIEPDEEATIGDSLRLELKRKWNSGNFTPYAFDDGQVCLDVGATELFVRNDPADPDNPTGQVIDFGSNDPLLWRGRLFLLRTSRAGRPEQTHVVIVEEVTEVIDHLFGGIAIAKFRWRADQALPFQICLADLILSGNVVPATAGESRTAFFKIGPVDPNPAVDDQRLVPTVEREGWLDRAGNRPVIHRFSLPDTDTLGLAFRDRANDLRTALPQIRLYEAPSSASLDDDPIADDWPVWTFDRTLLVEGSDDAAFTLEDGTWRRIISFQRRGVETVHRDYATGAGYTIRFGDGVFGSLPPPAGRFRADYRTGPGARANVPAGSITSLEVPGVPQTINLLVTAVTNPFAVTDGVDPESVADIKALVPEAYKAIVNFAVRPEDYGAQAERLDFVQRAQGTLRWTGTWHAMQVAVDPSGSTALTTEQRQKVNNLMDCVRQAGREVIVLDPKFVNLDLIVHVCLQKFAFPATVRDQVLEVLLGRRGFRPTKGFFDPDHFTFGTPLRRSALEAAIHDVGGVHSVVRVEIRPHGFEDFRDFDELIFAVDPDQVVRLENDPLRPERGSLNIVTEGGA